MTAVKVLVVGSANVDFTVAAARLPSPGETVTNGTLLVNHGGKGANQAVAARRLGADVRFIGCVGRDESGAAIRAALAAEGIGVDGLMDTAAAATGTALIVVDAVGHNQIAVAPGANRALTLAHVASRQADVAWADVVVCQLETPLPCVIAALTAAHARGAATILNPAPVPDGPLSFLPQVDYLTPNAGEAARLSGLPV
ncbi:MAG: ribokinase, partial [Candidatus Rokubacteria bacterium]|nr:ribokinase [Candidatus Rokubacteria bacterium]